MNLKISGVGRVHRADCDLADGAPWHEAESMTSRQVTAAIIAHGYVTCRKCRPLNARLR